MFLFTGFSLPLSVISAVENIRIRPIEHQQASRCKINNHSSFLKHYYLQLVVMNLPTPIETAIVFLLMDETKVLHFSCHTELYEIINTIRDSDRHKTSTIRLTHHKPLLKPTPKARPLQGSSRMPDSNI